MENKSKNYKILQTIAKIGKILSKVAFVFSIIGICGCFVGLFSNVFGSGKVFKIGDVTIYGLLADFDAYNVKSISTMLVACLIVCIGQAALAKFAEFYFRNAEASIIVGIMFIVGSFICGYGAEVLESRNKALE